MISKADNGTDKPTINKRQSFSSFIVAECASGINQARRHPAPVAAIQISAAGIGNSAQARDRSGIDSANAASAASTVVAADPNADIHMSGAAASRRITAETSHNAISTNAVAATAASHISALTAGDRSLRIGRRCAARSRIRCSWPLLGWAGDTVLLSLPERGPQRLERAMQIDLERALRALRQRRGVGQRPVLQDQMLHRFPLSLRQSRKRPIDARRVVGVLNTPRGVGARIDLRLVIEWCVHFAQSLTTGAAQMVDCAALRNHLQPGG